MLSRHTLVSKGPLSLDREGWPAKLLDLVLCVLPRAGLEPVARGRIPCDLHDSAWSCIILAIPWAASVQSIGSGILRHILVLGVIVKRRCLNFQHLTFSFRIHLELILYNL